MIIKKLNDSISNQYKIRIMLKIIKKVIYSALSILGVSCLVWIVLMLNPSIVYSNSTTIDNVTVYHNAVLQPEAEEVVKNALAIIETSDIYDERIEISLCMNDGTIYPNLHPTASGTAYTFLNNSVMYASKPDFKKNISEFEWEINNYELRKYNLTVLIAHEFMHAVQNKFDPKYYLSTTISFTPHQVNLNWKLEGHADYIARQFKNDGNLIGKIKKYQVEERKEHIGVPVFELPDGTIQNLGYYKYAIVIQYLMEEKGLNFKQLCELESEFDQAYSEMIEWSKS